MTNLEKLRQFPAEKIADMLVSQRYTNNQFSWYFNKFNDNSSRSYMFYDVAIEACIEWLNEEI